MTCPYCGGPVGPDLRARAGGEISDAAVVAATAAAPEGYCSQNTRPPNDVVRVALDTFQREMLNWRADISDDRPQQEAEMAAMTEAVDAALSASPAAPPAQDEVRPPPFPHIAGVQFYAVNGKGEWHYVNHARTWQGMPAPSWVSVPPPDTRTAVIVAARAAAGVQRGTSDGVAWLAIADLVEAME